MGDLSEHFDSAEFKCHDGCGSKEVSQLLVDSLEELRLAVGRPIRVVSGRRCEKQNALVHGAKNSQHMAGTAADIVADGFPLSRLFLLAAGVAAFHVGGIGIYPDARFIHVDVRGNKARWGHIGGAYVPFLTAWERLKQMEGMA